MTDDVPLISVCVPTYNGEAYLAETLRSIADQTYTHYEVIVVDDQSSDRTVEVARAHAECDPRIQVHINANNLGLVGNWNRSLELAKGQWIKFLFQDDLIVPTCLAKMIQAGMTGCGFVACARTLRYEGPISKTDKYWYERHLEILADSYRQGSRIMPEQFRKNLLDNYGWNIVGEPSVTLVRADLFKRFGLFDPLIGQSCDSEMWNRIGVNLGIDYLSEELATFRVHATAASAGHRHKPFRGQFLDRIVETHRALFDERMKPFRTYVSAVGKLKWLEAYLFNTIQGAFDFVRNARATPEGNERPLRELTIVLDALSNFKREAFRHQLFRLTRKLRPARNADGLLS